MAETHASIIDKTRDPIRLPNKVSLFLRHLGDALFRAEFPPKPGWQFLTKKFEMQRQSQKLWCWAAVAASVADYYDKPQEYQSQCLLAKEFLEGTEGHDCCGADENQMPAKSPCNRKEFLHPVLYAHGCVEEIPKFDPATLVRIYQEIDLGRPLCVRILWNGANDKGHFVTIVGYNRAAETLAVMDPDPTRWKSGDYNESTYKALCVNYAGLKGKWDQTYFTKNV